MFSAYAAAECHASCSFRPVTGKLADERILRAFKDNQAALRALTEPVPAQGAWQRPAYA